MYASTCTDGKTNIQIDHILEERRWHSGIVHVRSVRGADTDHRLVVTKVRERLAVSKEAAQKFDGEIFNLGKLNELQFRKQCKIEISNRFAALENLNDSNDTNRSWKNIKENIKIPSQQSQGLYELKQHKPWFDEECSGFLDQKKQAKVRWLQDPSQRNVDNLKSARHEASKQFRKKKEENLKANIDELETHIKIENIRLV